MGKFLRLTGVLVFLLPVVLILSACGRSANASANDYETDSERDEVITEVPRNPVFEPEPEQNPGPDRGETQTTQEPTVWEIQDFVGTWVGVDGTGQQYRIIFTVDLLGNQTGTLYWWNSESGRWDADFGFNPTFNISVEFKIYCEDENIIQIHNGSMWQNIFYVDSEDDEITKFKFSNYVFNRQ
ncbi:MAG: hypothetical protein FWC00_02235 [Firmicutes bacterium]|nr:hypothetical protein [Bacillota bacterium]